VHSRAADVGLARAHACWEDETEITRQKLSPALLVQGIVLLLIKGNPVLVALDAMRPSIPILSPSAVAAPNPESATITLVRDWPAVVFDEKGKLSPLSRSAQLSRRASSQ
jgi:hypothetical protein